MPRYFFLFGIFVLSFDKWKTEAQCIGRIYKSEYTETDDPENFLSRSCFVCSEPTHFWEATRFLNIPTTSNYVEFGILPHLKVQQYNAHVAIGLDCRVDIEIIMQENGTYNTNITFLTPEPKKIEPQNMPTADSSKNSVLSFTVVWHAGNKKINLFVSNDDKILSSAKENPVATEDAQCIFNITQLKLLAVIVHTITTQLLTVPLVLPCSPGGYLFNYKTGKLTEEDDYINRIFKNRENFERAKKTIFEGDPTNVSFVWNPKLNARLPIHVHDLAHEEILEEYFKVYGAGNAPMAQGHTTTCPIAPVLLPSP